MRRLKQTRLRTFLVRPRIVAKDDEGVPMIAFGDPIAVRGEIWPATSKRQIEQYGDRIDDIANMRIQGNYAITLDKRVVAVNVENGPLIHPGDGVHVYAPEDEDPDYEVRAFTQYYPLRLEVERRG